MPADPHQPPGGTGGRARVHLRFEDVTQDGRLVLEALPNALGPTVWMGILHKDPTSAAMLAQGIVPILSRLVLEGRPGPFSATTPVEAEGHCRLARAEGRIVLDMGADLVGVLGRTYGGGESVEHAGERALAGRVMAEHVLTRPFAPPGERRVTSLDFPGAPRLDATRPASPTPESIAGVPKGATPLEARSALDPAPILFGVMHTDSNRHVNSLVYLRVFEEAALRRFAALGRGEMRLARTTDIAYRRPCFAGQATRVLQQAFEDQGRLGVAAVLIDEKDAASEETLAGAKPHAYVRMMFEP